MTNVQKLQVALSQSRKALSEHLSIPEEQRSEDYASKLDQFTREVASKDAELVAAQLVEQEPEQRSGAPEDRELRDLHQRANVGNVFDAVLERRNVDGVERDLQEHYELAFNQVPIELLKMARRTVTRTANRLGVLSLPTDCTGWGMGTALGLSSESTSESAPSPRMASGKQAPGSAQHTP